MANSKEKQELQGKIKKAEDSVEAMKIARMKIDFSLKTQNPFVATMYHVDHYPAGNGKSGPVIKKHWPKHRTCSVYHLPKSNFFAVKPINPNSSEQNYYY